MCPNLKKNSDCKAKPKLFFLSGLFLILCFSGFSQIDIQRYTTATDTFYWKRYVSVPKPPRVNLNRFTVSQPAKKIEAFQTQMANESEKKFLYPIEINGDKLPDMVYSGSDSSGPEIVRIWINRNDSFDLIFEDYSYLSALVKKEGKLTGLQTADAGSGQEYLYFTRDYRVEHSGGEPVFVKAKQTVTYRYTEEPAKFYPAPIPFYSMADTLMLRASAAQQNEPFIPELDSFGNIIAKYRSASRGTILAKKTYGNGNDWFFVEMSPFSYPAASILYGMDKMPTFIRGWVSGLAIQAK
jgi:hypothetical protein